MRWRIALSVGMGRNRPALGRLKEGGVVLQILCHGLRAIRMQLVFFRSWANEASAAFNFVAEKAYLLSEAIE